MGTSETLTDSDWGRDRILAGVLLVAGIGLAATGSYIHFAAAAQMRAETEHCAACSLVLWHPLFVVAPLVVGSVFVLVSGYLLCR